MVISKVLDLESEVLDRKSEILNRTPQILDKEFKEETESKDEVVMSK